MSWSHAPDGAAYGPAVLPFVATAAAVLRIRMIQPLEAGAMAFDVGQVGRS